MNTITYDVRIYKTEVYRGKRVTTYTVRWKTGTKTWKEPFRVKAQADSFKAELRTAARKGEAFDLTTGRPVSWARGNHNTTWYDFAVSYVDMKWKHAAGKYRRDIARALTAATLAMLASQRGKPDDGEIRKALRKWGFNTKNRDACPDEYTHVLKWLSRNTKPVMALADPDVFRCVLDAIATKQDGKPAAATTVARNRAVLHNACEYAITRKLLAANPVKTTKWKAPKASHEVDRRSVVNPAQARRLLDAVRAQGRSGPRLVAFFAMMYYAGLRPEEAVNLRVENITLPPLVWNEETQKWEPPADDWGELYFCEVASEPGAEWTDDGARRETRRLKARAQGEWRRVPTPPPLTKLLRSHLEKFGPGPDGRVFYGIRGGELPMITYRRAWEAARKAVFSPAEYASPLAKRPYDLRHACVSTWLNGGVPPTQVAEWAGHSVDVLLRVYAKCIVGQDKAARRRIEEALREEPGDGDGSQEGTPKAP
ncbi:tyrosine-type recombinase/integrase [Thermomonospora cellulosilytica]|uniref:Integrase n=1 Tax=Thermomonospora cellulosilytica TaxID=1411118 RepID=A0A7W3MX23_9ACTN|nr:tyrosine-type recombinase/integrase [Thermomonospora cellulosilytica]MBA9003473.1 integrase [Thermomonospora cellulosilytica]